jgi:hypothetical protein
MARYCSLVHWQVAASNQKMPVTGQLGTEDGMVTSEEKPCNRSVFSSY